MVDPDRVVLVHSAEIAERGAVLFDGAPTIYANGQPPVDALQYKAPVVVGPDAEWRDNLCRQLADNGIEAIKVWPVDVSTHTTREEIVWLAGNGGPVAWVPSSAPQVAIPSPASDEGEVAGKEDSDGLPLRASPDTPAAAEPSEDASGGDWSAANISLDVDEEERAEQALHSIRMASAVKSQAHADEQAEPGDWPEPMDLWNSRTLPRFDPEWVIPCLRAVSANNAAMVGCDQGIDYLQRIAFSAGCLDDSIKVRVRPTQEWEESARIWACILGDSGDGKSPCMKGIAGPSRDLRFEIAERSKEKFAKYKAEFEVYELDRKAWVMAKHKGDPVGLLPVPPAKPVNELLYFSSTTSEGLLEQQEQSTRGTMLEADEVIGWASGMDQYKSGGKGSDKAFWLSSWNGAEYVGILVGKLRTIHNTGVTIIGGTQPGAIRSAMQKSNFTTEDGLVQRFLFHVSNGLADEDSEQPADRDAIARWKNIIHRLYAMKPHLQACEFTPQAHAVRQKMNDWLNRLRAIHTIPDAERQALAKWRAYFPRIALTLGAIQAADSGCEIIPAQIEADTAEFTYRYMTECLWPSMDHFFGEALENTEDMRSLKGFAEYCLARDKRMIITTELSRNWSHYRGIKSINLRREFWASVVMSGWARPVGTIARNEGIFSRYEVNPLAFDGRFGERAAAAKVAAQAYREAMHPAMNRREPGEEG